MTAFAIYCQSYVCHNVYRTLFTMTKAIYGLSEK